MQQALILKLEDIRGHKNILQQWCVGLPWVDHGMLFSPNTATQSSLAKCHPVHDIPSTVPVINNKLLNTLGDAPLHKNFGTLQGVQLQQLYDVVLSKLHHLPTSRPYQQQVCLVSSDWLHTHLALPCMPSWLFTFITDLLD